MPIDLKWLALAPLSWLIGGTMFASSFERVERVPVLTNAYNNQTQEVTFGVPATARMILQFGGAAIAIGGTAAAAFLAVGSATESRRSTGFPNPIPGSNRKQLERAPNQKQQFDSAHSKLTSPRTPAPTGAISAPVTQPVDDEVFESDLWRSHDTDTKTDSAPAATPEPIVLSGYGNKAAAKPEQISELNLIQTAALYGCGQNSDGIKVHLLIPAITQSGKTSTLCGMIREVSSICPDAVWNGVDPKGSVFLGLERLCHIDGFPVIVTIDLNDSNIGVEMAVELLRRALNEQTRRKKQRQKAMQTGQAYNPTPYIVVLDEWPTILKAAKDCDQTNGTKHRQTIIQLAETLAFVGLEDSIFLWIVAQSPYVGQLGFDGSVAAQCMTLALCRGFNLKSVELCKQAIARCTTDDSEKTQLFQTLKQLSSARPNHPVCFSSAGGQIAYAPNLRDIQRLQLFQAATPPVDEDAESLRRLSPRAIAAEFNRFVGQQQDSHSDNRNPDEKPLDKPNRDEDD